MKEIGPGQPLLFDATLVNPKPVGAIHSISLPGYQTFNTEVDLVAKQKFQIKTDLIREGSPQAHP
jgi:hypothetical protein